MKPTQKDLIRLARLAGFHVGEQFAAGASENDLERFATLLLVRFGAGGGEPDAYMAYNTKTGERCPFLADDPDLQHAKSFAHVKTQALYLHPSPTDLRAEYLRGLDDAARVAADDAHVVDGRGYYDQLGDAKSTATNIREAIRALKGKQ